MAGDVIGACKLKPGAARVTAIARARKPLRSEDGQLDVFPIDIKYLVKGYI